MMEKHTISVLMPAYNVEKYVSTAIESILNQTYRNLELLVIDDASTDATVKVIKTFNDSRLKLFFNEKNIGYLKTCNKLFDLAAGNFIAFQDSDDYSDVRRLELQMLEFEKDPDLDVCGTNLTAMRDDGTWMFCSNYALDRQTIMQQMLQKEYPLIPNSFVFKRKILTTVGKYHEFWDRIGAEDYYWAWLIMEKHKLINIKPALYYYRYNPKGVTGNWTDKSRKRHTAAILHYLLKRRHETGTDPLEQNDLAALESFIDELDKPYRADPSRFYREMAQRDFYMGYKKRALQLMLKAIGKHPLKTINYKDFLYYLRKKPTV
ncbi:MAG TPA: glycosyltransferase family A protein [Chitinophagales bacterium]|nr:glycosyltransferase family A protein [Chitinophagales bacterium]